uniref:protein shisa-4 isoform X2 n=1 Tax=Pristiophorus japonicus TaxID=55135 RepID=UPI00398F6C91
MDPARTADLLLAAVFLIGAVSADNDCLWYTDTQGNWRSGIDCSFLHSCCGNCSYRYCCLNPMELITEKQQKYCMHMNLRWERGDSQLPNAASVPTQHASWPLRRVPNSSSLQRRKSARVDSQLPNAASVPTQHASWLLRRVPNSSSLQRRNCSPVHLMVAGLKRNCFTLPV